MKTRNAIIFTLGTTIALAILNETIALWKVHDIKESLRSMHADYHAARQRHQSFLAKYDILFVRLAATPDPGKPLSPPIAERVI